MYNKNKIVQIIRQMIKPQYIKNSTISLKKNISEYDSIVVSSKETTYRNFDTSEVLFARIKTTGKLQYFSVAKKYHTLFDYYEIPYTKNKSDTFIRISLDIFFPQSNKYSKLPIIFNSIFIDIFSFPAFGCCSKYVECSDAGHCIHDDLAYSTSCQYRKNLENGKIFYGKNKNI